MRILALFVGFCVLAVAIGLIGLKLLLAVVGAVVGAIVALVAALWPVLLPVGAVVFIVWLLRRRGGGRMDADPDSRRVVDRVLCRYERMERRVANLEDVLDSRR